MRGIAYGVAAIAAVGIMIAIASMPQDDTDSVAPASAVSVSPKTMQEAGTLTLAVPEMMCQYSCFPNVKKTLEKDGAVTEVVLGPQESEEALDNRQVIVQYNAGFDLAGALDRLNEQGFTDSMMVQ